MMLSSNLRTELRFEMSLFELPIRRLQSRQSRLVNSDSANHFSSHQWRRHQPITSPRSHLPRRVGGDRIGPRKARATLSASRRSHCRYRRPLAHVHRQRNRKGNRLRRLNCAVSYWLNKLCRLSSFAVNHQSDPARQNEAASWLRNWPG